MQGPRTFSKLRSVHPHSIPAGMTASSDGRYLFVAEAGTLAVIDSPSGLHDEIKFAPVSGQGVRPVELALDPDGDLDLPRQLRLAGGHPRSADPDARAR